MLEISIIFVLLCFNLYFCWLLYILPYLKRHTKPHVLAVYAAEDFNRELMINNLYNSGLPYTLIESGFTKDYLAHTLSNEDITVFELSAHGDGEGFWINEKQIPFGWLRTLLEYSSVRLVLLLSCRSHEYESLVNSGCVTVSLSGDVEDEVVLRYTKELYNLLGHNAGYREASVKAKRILSADDYHKIQVRWNNNE